jgi:hypothetical protein
MSTSVEFDRRPRESHWYHRTALRVRALGRPKWHECLHEWSKNLKPSDHVEL